MEVTSKSYNSNFNIYTYHVISKTKRFQKTNQKIIDNNTNTNKNIFFKKIILVTKINNKINKFLIYKKVIINPMHFK